MEDWNKHVIHVMDQVNQRLEGIMKNEFPEDSTAQEALVDAAFEALSEDELMNKGIDKFLRGEIPTVILERIREERLEAVNQELYERLQNGEYFNED